MSVYPYGLPNHFAVRFCHGASWEYCEELAVVNMGRDRYDRTATGGEGNCGTPLADPEGCPIGWIGSHQNHFLRGGPGFDGIWYPYCYTDVHNNVAAWGGSISACGPFPDPDWSVNFR